MQWKSAENWYHLSKPSAYVAVMLKVAYIQLFSFRNMQHSQLRRYAYLWYSSNVCERGGERASETVFTQVTRHIAINLLASRKQTRVHILYIRVKMFVILQLKTSLYTSPSRPGCKKYYETPRCKSLKRFSVTEALVDKTTSRFSFAHQPTLPDAGKTSLILYYPAGMKIEFAMLSILAMAVSQHLQFHSVTLTFSRP